ncbi:MAG: 2,3-bisphosphoglycerate-independent phosphoglycerate mutase [Vampirovibrionales bacterium]|nr:2,3-bisphosphoglycerate-independent phosphoglycerate mutase [Vampirovibrionales bacterium]
MMGTPENLKVSSKHSNTPLVLLILDGWGLDERTGDVLAEHGGCQHTQHPVATDNPTQTHAPYLTQLMKTYPWMPLQASGLSVGLPVGQMGNSEVGHLTMGSGRIVYQDLTLIDHAIETGELFTNAVLIAAMEHAKTQGTTLNLMGLVSPGGVHSHENHLLALLDMAKQRGVAQVHVHAFLDGRDVPPQSVLASLELIEKKLLELDYPQIQTISGRYYAMDRDKRWDRVELAYDNLTLATGKRHFLSLKAVETYYAEGITDEFIPPCVTDITFQGIQDNDAVIFFNFRPDRARQITKALTQEAFPPFERKKRPVPLHFACMTTYDEAYGLPVAYPKDNLTQTFGQLISDAGLRQFRCAETEKYAHVTYFFNGMEETPFAGEQRRLINSPKVATYDLQPEMSLPAVTDAVVKAITGGQFEVLIVNIANPDMVGHTGFLGAAQQAVTAVDNAIQQITEAVLAQPQGCLFITADHGNVEQMMDEAGGPHTAHTTHRVPFVAISQHQRFVFAEDAKGDRGLSHIAPTLLQVLGLTIPPVMQPSLLAAIHPAAQVSPAAASACSL